MKAVLVDRNVASEISCIHLRDINHEFRGTLNVLALSLRLLGGQSRYLQIINNQISILQRLAEDISEMSTIGASSFSTCNMPYDLHYLIEAVETSMALVMEEREISLIVEWGSDIPRFMNGDSERTKQILINLLSNASKASRKKAAVTLKITNSEECIKFGVIDEGPGMTQGVLETLFKPFPLDRDMQGTGLGLSICKQLVDSMGDKLSVESSEAGTSFVLEMYKNK